MRRGKYVLLFGAALLVLGAGALWLIGQTGTSTPAAAAHDDIPASEGTERVEIGDPSLIVPPAEAYERFAADDAAWRARHAPPLSRRHFAVSTGEWRASPRQIMRDSVFALVNAGRLAEAIAALEAWVQRNPRDGEQIVELARLLNQAGRTEESLARYRQALSLRGGAEP